MASVPAPDLVDPSVAMAVPVPPEPSAALAAEVRGNQGVQQARGLLAAVPEAPAPPA